MATIQQQQSDDTANDARSAMKAAAASIDRERGRARFLQKVGKKILSFVKDTRGVDQVANLRKLTSVSLTGESVNLSNLEAAIRDSGWAVVKSFLEVSQPQKAKYPSAETAAEYEQLRRGAAVLRGCLAIGAQESELRRVNRIIDESGD